MDSIKLALGIASSILAIVCFIPYFRDIFKKKSQPHMYSWLVWSGLQIVGVATQLRGGAGYGAWALIIGSFCCTVMFLLSIKYGTKNISKSDRLALIAASATFVFYLWQQNDFWAVILITIIDFIGFIPTFRKSYEEPWSETLSLYALGVVACGLSILALETYSVVTMTYISSLFITNLICALILFTRRKKITCPA